MNLPTEAELREQTEALRRRAQEVRERCAAVRREAARQQANLGVRMKRARTWLTGAPI